MSVENSTAGEDDRSDLLADARTSPPEKRFADAYGLAEQRQKLEQLVLEPLATDEAPGPVQTVCIGGPAGAGKMWLAEALAGELAEAGFSYYCPSTTFEEYEPFRQYVMALVDDARENEPSVILFEDGDSVYDTVGGTLTDAVEAAHDAGDTVLALATLAEKGRRHRPSRRQLWTHVCPDVFVEVDEPSLERRTAMLRDLLCDADESAVPDIDPQELDVDALAEQLEWALPTEIEFVCERIEHLAARTDDGPFTQAEIEEIITEVRRERERAAPERFDDRIVEQSASDGVTDRHLVEETEITYDDVGGLDSVIDRLTELLVVPEQYPTLFENSNLQATRGVLLHGPPGNGKTLLARALATETDRTFLSVRGPELKNKWFGESERRIRELFETADEQAPSIVFFDELDAIAGDRNACSSSPTTSMVNMLLSEMDGLEERGDVLFLAATNRIDALDEAVLRPGRIGATVEITPPDAAGQAEIFEIYAADLPTDEDVTPGWFADTAPAGLSGAEIEGVCRQALHAAVRDGGKGLTIAREHVTQSLNSV